MRVRWISPSLPPGGLGWATSAPGEDGLPTKEEVTLAARLVHAGIVPKEQAEAVLKERESLRDQLVPPSLLDLLVRRGLITRTELMIFRDRPLEELQPQFPDLVCGFTAQILD